MALLDSEHEFVCCGLDFAKFLQFDPIWSTKLCDTDTRWAFIILT